MNKKVIYIGLILSIFLTGCGDQTANRIGHKASEALTLHYIQNEIYSPVQCDYEVVNGRIYVLCDVAPNMDKETAALYEVKYDETEAYKIYALTGKAMRHAEKGLFPIAEESHDPTNDLEAIRREF